MGKKNKLDYNFYLDRLSLITLKITVDCYEYFSRTKCILFTRLRPFRPWTF